MFGNYRRDLVPGRSYEARVVIGTVFGAVDTELSVGSVSGSTHTPYLGSPRSLALPDGWGPMEVVVPFQVPTGCLPTEVLVKITGPGTACVHTITIVDVSPT